MSYGSVTDLISRFEEDENINEQVMGPLPHKNIVNF